MEKADKRIIDLKLRKGEMTEKFLDKHLAALPDLSGQVEEIPADLDKRKTTKS